MPVKRFIVTVEASEKNLSANAAIASASAYLAYADTTNTFAQSRSIYGASVNADAEYQTVELSFEVMIENESHYHEFTDELENIARVKDSWSQSYNE
jgi:hypothetical protein